MTPLLRRLTVLAALLVAAVSLLPAAGNAQIPLPIPTGSPTDDPDPEPSPTPTKTKEPDPDPSPTRTPTGGGGGGGRGGDDGSSGSTQQDPVVARGVARWLARQRTPARTTTRLLELIERAHGGPGDPVTLDEKRAAFGRFPVVGYVWYQDDYLAPRYIPSFHLHVGTDLFAVSGTPVIAVVDGTIWKTSVGGTGGTAVWLMGDDGVRYYYGHLRDIARGITTGLRVRLGDVLGHVGATGSSATGTYPHVHFEVNPGGRGTVNPKPILDAWLRDAEAAAIASLRSVALAGRLDAYAAARWPALFDLIAEPTIAPPALWTAAIGSPTIAGVDLALARILASSFAGAPVAPPATQPWQQLAFVPALGEHDHAAD